MQVKKFMTGVAFATALTLGSLLSAQAAIVYDDVLFDASSPLEPDTSDSVQSCFHTNANSNCVKKQGGHNYIGAFEDNYSILVTDTTDVAFTAAPANPKRPSIADFMITLLQGSTVLATAANFSDFVVTLMAGQSYTLQVSGTASKGSSYTVDVSGACPEGSPDCGGGAPSPVPLPGGLPLLAAGLAGLGILHRSKRKQIGFG